MKTFIAIARQYREKYKNNLPFIWTMCKDVARDDVSKLIQKFSSSK